MVSLRFRVLVEELAREFADEHRRLADWADDVLPDSAPDELYHSWANRRPPDADPVAYAERILKLVEEEYGR